MKKTHIAGIIIIALAVTTLIISLGDTSAYVTFDKAEKHPGKEYHVVGKLAEDKPLIYNPRKDPNFFAFYMIDSTGRQQKVIYRDAKPRDFERSDKIVIIGQMGEKAFHASKILMKCPSKYQEKKINIKEASSYNNGVSR